MPASSFFSVRTVLLIDGEWANTEIHSGTNRKAVRAWAQDYAKREGRACFIHRLPLVETVWAGGKE